MVNLPINSTHYAKLYPQNGERIATVDSVTSFRPVYTNRQTQTGTDTGPSLVPRMHSIARYKKRFKVFFFNFCHVVTFLNLFLFLNVFIIKTLTQQTLNNRFAAVVFRKFRRGKCQ